MITQRRLDELKVQAAFRVNQKLERFYTNFYGRAGIEAMMQQQSQPQMPQQPQMQQMPPSPMMEGSNGT